jgi:hypothetical protein
MSTSTGPETSILHPRRLSAKTDSQCKADKIHCFINYSCLAATQQTLPVALEDKRGKIMSGHLLRDGNAVGMVYRMVYRAGNHLKKEEEEAEEENESGPLIAAVRHHAMEKRPMRMTRGPMACGLAPSKQREFSLARIVLRV